MGKTKGGKINDSSKKPKKKRLFASTKNKPDASFEPYSSLLTRNNPQPVVVKHIRGLANVPICNVNDELLPVNLLAQMNPAPAIPPIDPLKRLPDIHLRKIPYKERAVQSIGMVPVEEPWRCELVDFTKGVIGPLFHNLKDPFPQLDLTAMHPAPLRRPMTCWITPRRHTAPEAVPLSRASNNTQRLLTPRPISTPGSVAERRRDQLPPLSARSSEKGWDSRQKPSGGEINYVYYDEDNDYEAQVFSLLCQLLQVTDVAQAQYWLSHARSSDKYRLMGMIREVLETKANTDLQTILETDENLEDDVDMETDAQRIIQKYHRIPVEERPITLMHSPYIYRPSSVASGKSSSVVPSQFGGCTPTQENLPEMPRTPIRLRYTKKPNSAFEVKDHAWYRSVAMNTSA